MDFPKLNRQKQFVSPKKEDIRVITREEADKNLRAAINHIKSSRGRFTGNVVIADSLGPDVDPLVSEPTSNGFNLTLKDPEEMRQEFEDAKNY